VPSATATTGLGNDPAIAPVLDVAGQPLPAARRTKPPKEVD
jgi:hypothetical protein